MMKEHKHFSSSAVKKLLLPNERMLSNIFGSATVEAINKGG
jgi:hypothetical protein